MAKGLASVKTLTAQEIADKWKLPLAVVAKKIAAGVKVEKEHTKSTKEANEIARDHLGERPDYYEKLHKMEKTKVVKEESATGAVRGLGYVSGDPGVSAVDQYVNTNALAYDPFNGAKLEFMKRIHNKLHNKLGFNEYDPKNTKSSNRALAEVKLNELGEYDNKGGMSGYEGTSAPIRAIRVRDAEVKEYWTPFLTPHHKHSARLSKEKANKPDTIMDPGAAGTTKTTYEETKMDTKELINEALDCILDNNLSEMKENFMNALQEKAMEKLEERKKEIAANYFAE